MHARTDRCAPMHTQCISSNLLLKSCTCPMAPTKAGAKAKERQQKRADKQVAILDKREAQLKKRADKQAAILDKREAQLKKKANNRCNAAAAVKTKAQKRPAQTSLSEEVPEKITDQPDRLLLEGESEEPLEVSPWMVATFPHVNPEYLRMIDHKYQEDFPGHIGYALTHLNMAMKILPRFPNATP